MALGMLRVWVELADLEWNVRWLGLFKVKGSGLFKAVGWGCSRMLRDCGLLVIHVPGLWVVEAFGFALGFVGFRV